MNSEVRLSTLKESARKSVKIQGLINILKYFKKQSTDNNKDSSYLLKNETTDNFPTTTYDQLDSNSPTTYKYEHIPTEKTPVKIEVKTSEDNSSKDESGTSDYLLDDFITTYETPK